MTHPNNSSISACCFLATLQAGAYTAMRDSIIKRLFHGNAAGSELEAFAASQGIHPSALLMLPHKLRPGESSTCSS